MKLMTILIALFITSNSAYAQQWVKQCSGTGNNRTCRMVQVGTPTNFKYSTPSYVYGPYTKPYVVNSVPIVTEKVIIKKIEPKVVKPKTVEVKPMFIVASVVEVESTTMSTRLILK